MFKYIVIFFGLKVENNFLKKFFSGIAFTTFSVFFIQMVLNLWFENHLLVIALKLFISIFVLSIILSFIFLIKFSKNIIDFYQELESLANENSVKLDLKFWTVIALFIYLLHIIIDFNILYKDTIFNKVFKIIKMSKKMRLSGFLFSIYGIGWFFGVQWIYFEFQHMFYAIIEKLLNSIKAKNSVENFKPTVDDLISAQKTIHQLIHFQSLLAKYIDFIQCFTIFLNISLYSIFVCLFKNISDNNMNELLADFLTLFLTSFVYFIGTQIILLTKRHLIKSVFKELEKWLKFKDDSELSVDLQVLMRSANLFLYGFPVEYKVNFNPNNNNNV